MRFRVYQDGRFASGAVAAGRTLTVYDDSAMATESTLYAASTGTTEATNPYTVPATGIIDFWVTTPRPYGLAQGDTVARPLRVLGVEHGVSVRDFGALGDGSTDDTTAIQAALDAGGLVIFPPGTYKITASLEVSSDTTISGYGACISVYGTAPYHAIINTGWTEAGTDDGVENVNILGLEIDGRKSTKTSATDVNSGRGISINSGRYCTVRDCYVHDTYTHGIWFGSYYSSDDDTYYTHHITVAGNRCENCGNTEWSRGYGIWFFWKSYDFVIADNVVTHGEAGGIAVDDASSGAEASKQCERFAITGNVVTGDTARTDTLNERGITVEGSFDFTVTGNTIDGIGDAIMVSDGQGNQTTGYGVISGNTVRAANKGIRILDSRDVLISGNDIEANAGTTPTGIRIESAADPYIVNVSVTGNLIKSTLVGVRTYTATEGTYTNVVFSGNAVLAIGDLTGTANSMGLYAESGAIRILNNTATGFEDGIRSASDSAIVAFNQVSGNKYGVHLTAAGNSVAGNLTSGNGSGGLKVDEAAATFATKILSNAFADSESSTAGALYHDNYLGSIRRATGTAAPVAGAWVRGDTVYNTTPSAEGYVGWVCTAAGTPGTWKGFGAIEA